MSNPLVYIDGIDSNTYTVRSSVPINITSSSGTTINYNIDPSNNYIYWIFKLNDVSYNITDVSYNITTTSDISNVGFLLVGDTNNYTDQNLDAASLKHKMDYNEFSLITNSHFYYLSDQLNALAVTNTSTGHIIDGCDFLSNHPHPLPRGRTTYKINDNNNGHDITDMDGVAFKYCYKPYDNDEDNNNPEKIQLRIAKNKKIKRNLANVSKSTRIGSIGGISQGLIKNFQSNENINILKTTAPVRFRRLQNGRFIFETQYNYNYSLQYKDNNITTTSAYYLENTAGTVNNIINNNEIELTQTITGTNYPSAMRVDKNGTINITYYYTDIVNYGVGKQDFAIPNVYNKNTYVDISLNDIRSVQIPFNIDSSVLPSPNILFNNVSKIFSFKPSGSYDLTLNLSFNGIYTQKFYNWRFTPYVLSSGLYNRKLIETDHIKCLHKPIIEDVSTPVSATPSFALIYYQFTIPEINILSTVSTLVIDNEVALNFIKINLPSDAPLDYTLSLVNISGKTIFTNSVIQWFNNALGYRPRQFIIVSRTSVTFKTFKNNNNQLYWKVISWTY
jgi:hypothetical protein